MTDTFYSDFEERYRGGRELIKSRLNVYKPFINALKEIDPEAFGIDLGCGRGEWLELLADWSFKAIGVDLDRGMLKSCTDHNLNAVEKDALAFLQESPDSSAVLISAFHVIEHIPFEQLRLFVNEAHRVLKPGGLLILETPNSDNLTVGTSSFYLDPTHSKPIPSGLLEFVIEHAGFWRTKTIGLQEDQTIGQRPTTLLDVLAGASPDYAVVAQTSGSELAIAALEGAFELNRGISLGELSGLYDSERQEQASALAKKVAEVEKTITQLDAERASNEASLSAIYSAINLLTESAERRANDAEQRAMDTQEAVNQTRCELHVVNQSNRHHWQLAQSLQLEVSQLRQSASWRITAPLRWLTRPLALTGARLASAANHLVSWAMTQPTLVRVVHAFVDFVPPLRSALQKRVEAVVEQNDSTDQPVEASGIGGLSSSSLTPFGKDIYLKLKTEIENSKKGR